MTVVISNDQPNFLSNCLGAIERQSFRSERILVVDTSDQAEVGDVLESFVARSSKHAVVKVEERANFAELVALGIKQALVGISELADVAVWLVHDDCVPEVHALAELVRTLELSPMVGIASPKQLAVENPKIIVQQGLTVTKTLKPFSLVNDELDQKQHDSMSDVLAVSSNAMLVRANLWADLGGFSLSAPALAQDIELGIRAHQSGFRVVVVPTARVRHGELSINNRRPKKWLGGSSKYALAKAANHLRLSQWPLLLAFFYWLTLPFISVIQVFWLLLRKRPDRIGFTLRANLWTFFTFRARLRDRHGASISALRSLFATREQVRSRARLALEIQEQKENLSSFESQRVTSQLNFAAGGGLWVMLALAAVSYKFFPLGASAQGGYALPLSDSWLQLFANTGSSFQHIGLGLAAPSDPINWIYLAIGSLTFFAPNLALSWLLILAKPLAFFGAWRLLSTITTRNSLRIIFALGYVFWPAFTFAQSEGNYPAVIFTIALPWLLFCLARVARVGISSSVRSSAQGWSWIAVSGLLLAVCYSSAPSTILLLALIFIAFLVLMRKRIVLGLLIVIPTLAIAGPYIFYQIVTNQNVLGVFVDPTLARPNEAASLANSIFGSDNLFSWSAIALMGLSSLALLVRGRRIFGAWILVAFAVVNIWLISSISFPSGGLASIGFGSSSPVYLSTEPSVMLLALVLVGIMALWLDGLTRAGIRKLTLFAVLIGAVLPLAAASVLQPSQVVFKETRNLPAIFTAEAKAGSQLRMLIITGNSEQSFQAELVQAGGIKLDAISSTYRMSPVNLTSSYPAKAELARLVANLVSANEQSLTQDLQNSGVGYILVPETSSNGDIQVALNTAPELDQVGTTEYGQLWRVKKSREISSDVQLGYWSITKTVQMATLFGFILLALPTARGRKKRLSNEFIEEESE